MSDTTPGSSGSKCIKVTYGGDLASNGVKLYLTNYSASGGGSDDGATLASNLNITIKEGSGGSFADCTGFAATSTVGPTAIGTMSTTYTDYSDGAFGTWKPSASDSRVYEITWTLASGTPNAAQGESVTCDFTWEVQS